MPQRTLSVVGTSSWVTDDPDDLGVPDEHVEAMVREGARLLPAVASARHHATWSAARPLIGAAGGVEGFVTITGGKATTLRGMAEVTADLICAKLGVDAPCQTRTVPLLPHTAHYLRQYRPEEGT